MFFSEISKGNVYKNFIFYLIITKDFIKIHLFDYWYFFNGCVINARTYVMFTLCKEIGEPKIFSWISLIHSVSFWLRSWHSKYYLKLKFIQGGTIKLSSWRKQHYSFILKLLLKKWIQVTWLCSRLTSIQCSRLQPQSPPRYGSGTGSIPFPQAPAGARWIHGGWRRSGWLWCCGRLCCWCSRRMIKRSNPAGSGQGRRGQWEEGTKS